MGTSCALVLLLVSTAYTSEAYAQTRQDASWQGGWVAMNEMPLESNADETAELVFSNSRSRSRNNNNNTDINAIVAQIIDSRREGRKLEQYDHVYADGNVEQALERGNDVEARNIIRDKLCFLGLMSCDVVEKRPQYIMPPIGRPHPMRYLNYNVASRPPPSFGPPKKVGFTQTFSPSSNYKPFNHGPYPTNAIIYSDRPTSSIAPPSYVFNQQPNAIKIHGPNHSPQHNSYYGQQSTAASSNIVVGQIATVPSSTAGLQQHVHHHYHHVDGSTNEKVTALPANQQQHPTNLAHIGGIQASASGYTGVGSLTVSGSNNFRPPIHLSSGQYMQGGQSQVSGSFHSQNPGYYKKELQNIGGLVVASSGGFSTQHLGGHNIERQQILNCFCTPFNQCPAADRIGRKEDLILPIDPRNLGKDFEALADDTFGNTTNTTRSEAKRAKRAAEPEANNNKSPNPAHESDDSSLSIDAEGRAYYGNRRQENTCRVNEICCRRPLRPANQQQLGRCGTRNAAGITGRIKNPVYVDGDSEFGEYPWHVAILKKDPKESIYACGATLIDALHVITAAHCIKAQNGFDLRARLGEWDVNHDVEFFPYVEREIVAVHIHPEYYAGTLDNDLALLRLDRPVDFQQNPHISPACLPDKFADFTGARCWTTGWGKDAFGDHGKYQNILKEVDVPILSHQQCELQLRQTRLGYNYKLNPGFLCAGGEEGKDACKGDGGGPLVCDRNGIWNVVGVVSWGIGCGQPNVPGVYVRVAHYIDWIRQLTQHYK